MSAGAPATAVRHALADALADALAGDERAALIAWATIAEGADGVASWLVAELGASGALVWLADAVSDPVAATMRLAPHASHRVVDKAVAAAERWIARLPEADPAEQVRRAAAVRARIITRADVAWPGVFEALGARAPYAVWVRGAGDLAALLGRSIAIVGSRASTAYGDRVAAELAGGISDAGWCVLSGGAYGIDAAAHRAALTGATPTVAVMAGGVDRPYPAGHADLLGTVMQSGVLFAEVPVGFAPHRSRFLARNRLIAAASATCVVEAAVRSGALNTVNHALEFGRPVGAVPGPVTSASSQGCHALIRSGAAVLVTDARQLVELAGPIGVDPAVGEVAPGPEFGDAAERAAFDAIAGRGSRPADVARVAGLSLSEALAALAGLEFAGLAVVRSGLWRRVTKSSSGS